VGPWFLPTFLNHSGLDNFSYALLLPSLDVCLHRLQTRIGHGFTDLGAAEHMWREFQDASIDARYLFSEVAPAAELAHQIVQRAQSGVIVCPSAASDSAATDLTEGPPSERTIIRHGRT